MDTSDKSPTCLFLKDLYTCGSNVTASIAVPAKPMISASIIDGRCVFLMENSMILNTHLYYFQLFSRYSIIVDRISHVRVDVSLLKFLNYPMVSCPLSDEMYICNQRARFLENKDILYLSLIHI